MWYVFTPLLCNEELERVTARYDGRNFSSSVGTPSLLQVAGLLWLVSVAF